MISGKVFKNIKRVYSAKGLSLTVVIIRFHLMGFFLICEPHDPTAMINHDAQAIIPLFRPPFFQ